jgi:hypothetical protein
MTGSCGLTARCCLALIVVLALGPLVPAVAAVTPEESRVLDRLDAKRTLRDLQHLSHGVVRTSSGLGAGTVVAGSVEERRLAAEITRLMKAAGLEVRSESFPVRSYRYGPVTLAVNGASLPAISLHAGGAVSGRRDGHPYARGNENDGRRIRAELVDAGDGYAADYARVGNVQGKVVLVRRELRDWPPAQITEAAQHGVLAVLFHGHPGSAREPDALRQDSMWSHDQIPAMAISHRSGEMLRAQLRGGAVQVVLANDADVDDGTSQNVVGWIRGTEHPDEWVVVSAHYDRWFEGAADNTSGVAAVLEIARAFATSGVKPRRSVMFVAAGSEEAGQEDPERDWLAGSYAFLGAHPDVIRNAALIFNIDLLGWSAPKATLHATADSLASARSVVADLGLGGSMDVSTGAGAVTDSWNFGVVGGAATQHVERINEDYFPIYHTQVDAYRPESFRNMGSDLRVLTLSLWRAANSERLPIQLSAIADSIAGRLRRDAERVPDVSFASVDAALDEFRAAALAVESRAAKAGTGLFDRRLMAVRHALVPWLYAVDDDFDQVVRTTPAANRVQAMDGMAAALREGNRAAALEALRVLYEGRQCLRLSPGAYAYERAFWAGDGGWATRYGHRLSPPASGFEALCARIADPNVVPATLVTALAPLRAEASDGIAQSVALMAAKLRFAVEMLR